MTDVAIGTLDEDKLDAFGRVLHQQAEKERGREKANQLAAAWRASEQRLAEQQWRENALDWYSHHLQLADLYAELSREHERRALKFLGGDGG